MIFSNMIDAYLANIIIKPFNKKEFESLISDLASFRKLKKYKKEIREYLLENFYISHQDIFLPKNLRANTILLTSPLEATSIAGKSLNLKMSVEEIDDQQLLFGTDDAPGLFDDSLAVLEVTSSLIAEFDLDASIFNEDSFVTVDSLSESIYNELLQTA